MLAKKLKLKPEQSILLLNAPSDYQKTLGTFPAGVIFTQQAKGIYDVVHLFVKNQAELQKYCRKALNAVKKDGLLWVFYPKKSSKVATDLSRDHGWDVLLKANWQWLSLISFNDTWSAFALRNNIKMIGKVKKSDASADYIDMVKRTVKLPEDLERAFKKDKKAAKFFAGLSFTNRKEYVVWITSAKRDETRQRRLALSLEKLNAGLKEPMSS